MAEFPEKILLVNPVTRNNERVLRVDRCQQKILPNIGIWPPINLLEIAVYLRYRGFKNIEIIDGEIEGLPFDVLSAKVARKLPDMVVIQTTTPTIEDDILFSNAIKNESKKSIIVFMGLHATVFPEQLLINNSIEYAVIGAPDNVVAELADYCFKSRGDIANIKGLGYKNGSGICINKPDTYRDNYDYPVMPDRALLKNELYIMPLTGKPFAVIKVSRGCDFECSFCTSRVYYGRGWRGRSPENIVEEIKDVKENYGIDTFLFLSDTFNNKKEFVDRLANMIIERNLNIKWVSNSRVDLVDENSVKLMKKSGCILVSLGVESYNESILHRNRKYIAREMIDKAIEIFKHNGILTYGYFIFGLEGETKYSMIKTLISAFRSKLDFAVFYSLTPYPGTDYFKRYNILDWKKYFHGISNIVEYDGLSKGVIKLWRHMSYIIFYIKPQRIILLMKYILQGRIC